MPRQPVILDLNHNLSPRQEFLIRTDFDESKHPRGAGGKFARKGAGRGVLQSGMSDDELDAAEAEMERQEQEEFERESPTGKSSKTDKKKGKAINAEIKNLDKKTSKPIKNPAVEALKTAAKIYLGVWAIGAVAIVVAGTAAQREAEQATKQEAESNEQKWNETLGVDKDADWATVRKAYKAKARQYHPDINKDPDAEEQMKAVNDAFENIEKIYESKGRKDSALFLITCELKNDALTSLRYDFETSKHPRDRNGRFARKGQGGGSTVRVNVPKYANAKEAKAIHQIFSAVANDPKFQEKKKSNNDAVVLAAVVAVYMGVVAAAVYMDVQSSKRMAKEEEEYWASSRKRQEDFDRQREEARSRSQESRRQWQEEYQQKRESYRNKYAGYGGYGGTGTQQQEKSWHETLGVDADADWQTVRKAYKAKAKQYHPDVNKDPDAEEMMKKVNDAFDKMDKLYERSGKKPRADHEQQIIQWLRQDFKENLHVRDNRGRFATKRGGSTSAQPSGSAGGRSAAATSRRRSKATTGLAVAGLSAGAAIGVAGLAAMHIKNDLKNSSIPFDSIRQPPGGIPDEQTLKTYDSFQPGDLIRKSFKGSLGTRQHYGVYVGKDPVSGEHMVVDTGTDWKDRDGVPYVRKQGLTWTAGPNDTEWEVVPQEDMHKTKGTKTLSREEIVERADKMLYQKFEYKGFESNCEAFARAIVETKAYSTQGQKVSPLTNMVSGFVTDSVLKLRTKNEYFPGAAEEKTRVKVGGYEFSGFSNYSREKNKWSAKKMADFLEMERVRDARRKSYENVPNPYSGKQEGSDRKALPARADAADEFDPSLNKRFEICLKREGVGTVDKDDPAAAFIDSVGLMQPEDYSELVEEMAGAVSGDVLKSRVRVEMTKDYLMVLTTLVNKMKQGESRKDSILVSLNPSIKKKTPSIQTSILEMRMAGLL